MKRFISPLLMSTGLVIGGEAVASDLLHWQDNSLTYLYGHDYKIDPGIQQTVTFEHVSGWSVGDLFVFLDVIKYNTDATNGAGDGHTFYGEISPRLSFGKLTGRDLSFGLVKDVLISATYEFGEDDVDAYLIGPAVDLDIPGFDFFMLNTYLRTVDGNRAGSNTWQITPAWSYTIPVGNSDILIDGFMDWVVDNDENSRGEYQANLHFNPQIKYDLGKALSWGEKQLYVGIEYDYWKNKYGIKDGGFVSENFVGSTDQNTASFLLKAHF
ncbi:outer membrane protein OmpK [Ectopseudomonas mendocina]|uniref:Outer membrane protein OmpK n=1 Tax=Ectopseudomonas mendocina TaxID=300 RepID=A0ABZ2RGK1_ECTME